MHTHVSTHAYAPQIDTYTHTYDTSTHTHTHTYDTSTHTRAHTQAPVWVGGAGSAAAAETGCRYRAEDGE